MSKHASGKSGAPPPTRAKPRWMGMLMAVAIVLLAGGLLWTQLPKGGYPTDLGRVGQGQPALVLVYDHFYVGGGEVMERLHAIRREHAGWMEFLVADQGEAGGRAFAERYGAGDGTVLLFAGDGTHVRTLHAPRTEEIQQTIIESFCSAGRNAC